MTHAMVTVAPRLSSASLLVGEHPSICRLRGLISRAAPLNTPVLIEGPTGSGKEVVVRELYRHSRLRGPLVCVNAATLPEGLAEAELFGVVKGAYTGAVQSRGGRLSEARGGMLYLDESADLAPSVQAKLLRVVETGEITRLGSSHSEHVAFRLVLSIQETAHRLIKRERWRPDFKYRVSGIVLQVPSLVDRLSDLPLLVTHFMAAFGRPGLDDPSMKMLQAFEWPGNVRQLRVVLERAVFLAGAESVDLLAVERSLEQERGSDELSPQRRPLPADLKAMLSECGWRVLILAKTMGVSRATAYRWLADAAIRPPRATVPFP